MPDQGNPAQTDGMTHVMEICKHIESASSDGSPFGKILITGFYDGPTEGFIECQDCGRAYAFRMLAWDDGQDVRIYGLTALELSLEHIRVEVLKLPPTDEAITLAPPDTAWSQNPVETPLGGGVEWVIAAVNLHRGILATKALDGDVVERDWFVWLGLNPGVP